MSRREHGEAEAPLGTFAVRALFYLEKAKGSSDHSYRTYMHEKFEELIQRNAALLIDVAVAARERLAAAELEQTDYDHQWGALRKALDALDEGK